MTNVNTIVIEIMPQAGSNGSCWKLGFLNSETKAAQNDTVTITNASSVLFAGISIDATGASETNTLATNVITLTSATTGAVSGFVLYR